MKLTIIAASLALLASSSAMASVAQWTTASGGNGHWYEFVNDGSLNWSQSETAAASSVYNGLTGYLATITSDEENSFINSLVSGNTVWVGGSDAAQEGVWQWVTGPEAGTTFSYTNWEPGEPNNAGDEDYLQMNWAVTNGQWNDFSDRAWTSGYVVEYSAPVPEPETYAMLLVGLGAMGAGLRRRKAAQQAAI